MCCLTTTSYISLVKTCLQQKAKLCTQGRTNLVSKELRLQTNQRGHVKPAVISLILECQYWVRVPGLPRMATSVVTAMLVPTHTTAATRRGRSCKKPPRWPAFSKAEFDVCLEVQLKLTWENNWLLLMVSLKFYVFKTTSKTLWTRLWLYPHYFLSWHISSSYYIKGVLHYVHYSIFCWNFSLGYEEIIHMNIFFRYRPHY